MKVAKSSATAIIIALNITIAQGINYDNCRTTTSTQTLACLGVRCRPVYNGGCNSDEYTDMTKQQSCTYPDKEAVGVEQVCYYENVCCPIDSGNSPKDMNDSNNNEKEEEWEEQWREEYQYDPTVQQQQSDAASSSSTGRAAGIAFMFISIAFAGLYFLLVFKKREESNNNTDVDDGSSGNEEENGAIEIYSHTNKKKKRRRKERAEERTIDHSHSDFFDSDSDQDSIPPIP